MTDLDPYMVTFLTDHPLARAVVYRMMKNAATTCDDPKMIAWYESFARIQNQDERQKAFRKLCER